MTQCEMTFPHRYGTQEYPELPGSGWGSIPVHYFPRATTRTEHGGIWLKVTPSSGTPWVGVFDFGYKQPPAISMIVTTPNPDRLCVVSAGAAYLVNANQPSNWEQLHLFPVLDVRLILDLQLIVFSTFHRLAALGAEGVVWESPRVCWDDLQIDRCDADRIEGTGFDPTSASEKMPFSVDPRTGRSLLPTPRSIDGKPIW